MPVRIIEKPEENRLFFEAFGPQPRQGEERAKVPQDQADAEIMLKKFEWERKNPTKQIFRFRKDPLAGGQLPAPGMASMRMVTPHEMWVAEYGPRIFRDDEEKKAWLEAQK